MPHRLDLSLADDARKRAAARGWENNDGAFGTFEFSVPDRTIALQHNDRYTDVNTTTHEF